MNQRGKARRDHGETSHDAADKITSISGRQRRLVFELIAASECGMTDEEMQLQSGLSPSSQRPRRVELVEGGHIVDSGARRKTKSGREAVVWVRVVRAVQGELFEAKR